MLKKLFVSFALLAGMLTLGAPTPAHAAYLQLWGQLTMLRVHDVGTAYGPPSDLIDVEVVIVLSSRPGQAFGFKLRNDMDQATHAAMLDLLRDAYANNWQVVINAELPTGKQNGVLNRVWVTR